MANTIALSASLRISGTGIDGSLSGNKTVTQSGTDFTYQSQLIGTSTEQLDLGTDLGTMGYLLIKNEDATNYVEVDSASTYDKFPQKIPPGELVLLKPQTTTIHMRANTANCLITFLAIEA